MFASNLAAMASLAVVAFHFPPTYAQSAGPISSKGCFTSSTGLTFSNTYQFQSHGWCQTACLKLNKPVMGLTDGGDCWCGDSLPPAGSKTDDSNCQHGCNGFKELCGGEKGTYGVYLTGLSSDVQNAVDDSSPSSSPISSSLPTSDSTSTVTDTKTSSAVQTTLPPSVVTVGGGTSVVTIPGSTVTQDPVPAKANNSPSASSSSGGTSTGTKVGIAVGVVLGVLAIAGLIVAALFFMKKKNNTVVGRHRRNTSTNPFNDQSLEGTRNGSISDSRLDPTMVEREKRLSNGSVFADNEDYSRRILKVTNPSDH